MKRILIVDDKAENLYYLQALLQGHGHTVETARHGAEALTLARQTPPDVIVSDLLMPVMDGYTLLRHWKADPRLKAVPFVVYTATYTEAADERLAYSLGADAFILKPTEPEEFVTQLSRVLTQTFQPQPGPVNQPESDDTAQLKGYSEALIRKLEEKTLQLETANRSLEAELAARKNIEAQLLRAQRMESIGTLAGGIAHDLNNLLVPIVMGVDLLRRLTTDPTGHTIIDSIERSAQRGTSLVQQVLSFARGVEGARVAVHLGHIMQEIENMVRTSFPKKITFLTECPKDLHLVTGDPTQLNQVMLNLCVNARDAMPDGGQLLIQVRNTEIDEAFAAMQPHLNPGPHVLVEVSDTGTGIPREVQERIFDPFYTTKPVGQGTGLGLATAIGIVRSHGGTMDLESTKSTGTTFRIYLPAQATDAPPTPAKAHPTAAPTGHGELILVVDDEAAVADITRQTLEAYGYRVITAGDGAEAMGLYAGQSRDIALIITDMMMPVMDGPTLIQAVHHLNPDVRIMVMSGQRSGSEETKNRLANQYPFLPKPYTAATLLTAVHQTLTRPT